MNIGTLIGLTLLLLVVAYLFFDYYLLKKGFDLSRRVKSFSIGIFLIGIGIFLFLYLSVGVVKEAFDLSKNGTDTFCIVTKSETVYKFQRGKRRAFHYNTVSYDGYVSTLSLDKLYDIGTKFPIVYSKVNPKTTMLGQKKDSFIDYCLGGKGLFEIVIVFILPITFVFIGVVKFRLFWYRSKVCTWGIIHNFIVSFLL